MVHVMSRGFKIVLFPLFIKRGVLVETSKRVAMKEGGVWGAGPVGDIHTHGVHVSFNPPDDEVDGQKGDRETLSF